MEQSRLQQRLVIGAVSAIAALAAVGLWLRIVPSDSTIPVPFVTAGDSLAGALTDIGTKGSHRIVSMTFDDGEVSESLAEDALHIVLTPLEGDMSDGAPLSVALTPGKKIFGYKYMTRSAAAERDAASRSIAGEPLLYPDLFPGQFFASDEARASDGFIADFEEDYNVQFRSLSEVTLDRDARYVILTNDAGTDLIVRNLAWCGDSIIAPSEQCDDGVRGKKDQCNDLCEPTQHWWFDVLDSLGPKDFPVDVISSSVRLISLRDGRHALAWAETRDDQTTSLFVSMFTPAAGWSDIQKVYEFTGQPFSHSLYDLNASADDDFVMIVWSENTSQFISNHHSTTYAIRSLSYDLTTEEAQAPVTLFTATVDGTIPIGLRDGRFEENLIVTDSPFSVLWAERTQYEPGLDDMSGVASYQFTLRAAVRENGGWMPAENIAMGRIRQFMVEGDSAMRAVLFWNYLHEPQAGCQNSAPPMWMTRFDTNGWTTPVEVNSTGWYNLHFETNPLNEGIITYTYHCETAEHHATNSLYYRTYINGVLGAPHLLETIETPGYGGWGALEIDVLPNEDFHIIWSAEGGWATPKQYTVSVP